MVLSVGAMGRSADKALIVNEAYRMLKPGGLFVFLEPGGDDVLDTVKKFFPEKIEIEIADEDEGSGSESSAADLLENMALMMGMPSATVFVPAHIATATASRSSQQNRRRAGADAIAKYAPSYERGEGEDASCVDRGYCEGCRTDRGEEIEGKHE